MNKSQLLTYDLYGAHIANGDYPGHPIDHMKKFGFKLIKGLPIPMFDSWTFEVEENDIQLPAFIKPIDDPEEYKEDPAWSNAMDLTHHNK